MSSFGLLGRVFLVALFRTVPFFFLLDSRPLWPLCGRATFISDGWLIPERRIILIQVSGEGSVLVPSCCFLRGMAGIPAPRSDKPCRTVRAPTTPGMCPRAHAVAQRATVKLNLSRIIFCDSFIPLYSAQWTIESENVLEKLSSVASAACLSVVVTSPAFV